MYIWHGIASSTEKKLAKHVKAWQDNDLDPKTPGNDYSVLKFYDFNESNIAPIQEKAPILFISSRENPQRIYIL